MNDLQFEMGTADEGPYFVSARKELLSSCLQREDMQHAMT